ncbi:lipopolysaccharide assembly protein LapA domain-containing protein [Devosia sp. ZB163]|uniref:lipopolysaccharide assembly protein LapA domain-containing protein n=1 Tax=Devosia sp. ZB163 TaxID=3025938 RepID=UPI00235EB311|nr:lipopolysaccharide assembly protein LapA domain-containing protein [Devosia sp. ZB163]MDC9822904.1 lipopolysaccharide assembly protein LapA domain-containing protein [Devosia sp. ZB163]
MFRRIVGWFVLVPLCAALIVFALANRQLVVVNFNPLAPVEALSSPGVGVPLFLVLFAVLLIGVLLGGIATWFAQSPHRRDERHFKRETERLHRELEVARRSPESPVTLAAQDFAQTN